MAQEAPECVSKRRAILAPSVPYITARARPTLTPLSVCACVCVCQLLPGPEAASASNRNKEELTPEKRDMPPTGKAISGAHLREVTGSERRENLLSVFSKIKSLLRNKSLSRALSYNSPTLPPFCTTWIKRNRETQTALERVQKHVRQRGQANWQHRFSINDVT